MNGKHRRRPSRILKAIERIAEILVLLMIGSVVAGALLIGLVWATLRYMSMH